MLSPLETGTTRGRPRERGRSRETGPRAGTWPRRAARGAGEASQLAGRRGEAGQGPSISYMEGPCLILPGPERLCQHPTCEPRRRQPAGMPGPRRAGRGAGADMTRSTARVASWEASARPERTAGVDRTAGRRVTVSRRLRVGSRILRQRGRAPSGDRPAARVRRPERRRDAAGPGPDGMTGRRRWITGRLSGKAAASHRCLCAAIPSIRDLIHAGSWRPACAGVSRKPRRADLLPAASPARGPLTGCVHKHVDHLCKTAPGLCTRGGNAGDPVARPRS